MIGLLLACAPPDTTRGVLVDALRGVPVAGATVRAEAEGEGCLRLSSVTDADGAFTLEAPCAGSSLTPVDPTWWLVEPVPLAAEVRLEVWPAPDTAGLFQLDGAALTPLVTNSPVGTLARPGGELRYPLVLPGTVPQLTPDDHVVLAGPEVAGWTLSPLLPTPAQAVAGPDGPGTFGEWVAIGPAAPVVAREVSAATAPSGRPGGARYLPVAGLASGRWFLGEGQASRGVVIDLVDR